MEVISLMVNNRFGVMQRVMGEFTRKKINVETIVVGQCELEGKARIVMTVKEKKQADQAVERLERLHDVLNVQIMEPANHEAYALVKNSKGKARLIGEIDEVEELIEETDPDTYVMTVNAL